MDCIFTGARVIDPASGTDTVADVAISGGRIATVGGGLVAAHPEAAVRRLDGLLLTPGLIDQHAHCFVGLGNFCLEPDLIGVGMGVPTLIDAGTSGVATFELARRAVIDHPATNTEVLALIDPNQLYLATKDFICHKLRIANDLRNLDLEATVELLERNRDVVLGFKVRTCVAGSDAHRSPFLEAAQEVAGELPCMIHLGRFPYTRSISTADSLDSLRPGDIVTHAYRGGGGALDRSGKVIPQFVAAYERGVRMDVGHSGEDFRFRAARALLEAGYPPHTISTDFNVFNLQGPVFSLATTMSKLWALGCSLSDVVAMTTVNVAEQMHLSETHGRIAVGRPATLSVLRVHDEPTVLSDGYRSITAPRVLEPVGCTVAGRWYDAVAFRAAPREVAA
ncbi:MAG: amidohydrolase/deacetylase family metallohydrolase [Acidimicrobiales bacterium]|nr:amidohydrolase/deacetylase family metallohydrolase [Acidimicrobiales bacterium]